MSVEPIYEEIKEAGPLIQMVSEQTNPVYSAIKIYGNSQYPLYVASDLGQILDIKNVDRVIKTYTPRECISAKIRMTDPHTGQLVDKNTKLLTKHGMYRLMFDSNSPVGEVFREFVYMVLDKLTNDGIVHLKAVQSEMQAQFSEEIDKATKYLQVKVQNLEHEIMTSSRITRRATELMHNKEQEAGRLSQESQALQMKIHNLEQKLLSAELSNDLDQSDEEQLLEYLKAKYLKRYLVYLLPTKDEDEASYDYTEYSLSNPPDESDTLYYRITTRECKIGNLVKEIYLETDAQFVELKNKLFDRSVIKNPSAKANDILLCDLYIINELANDIRNRPITERKKEKRAQIEASLSEMRKIWDRDYF
jgi:prophage antirepressor-like protein